MTTENAKKKKELFLLPMDAFSPFPTTPGARPHLATGPLAAPGPTHKVRSLGMWLKLDTGMVVMLLLFRVLVRGNQSHRASVQ